MDHTYLRYECADSFGLTVAAASSKSPSSVDQIVSPGRDGSLLTVTGSTVSCWSSKGQGLWKWGHRNKFGTGQSLNSDEVVCIDVSMQGKRMKLATGWVDGAVRILDMSEEAPVRYNMTHSLIEKIDYDFPEPLELQGHSHSPVRCVVFDESASRLASGSSDGAIILWDLVAESGLFRLLGHKGAIKDVQFQRRGESEQNIVISSGMDGLVKIWNLAEQCCTQTIANHQVSSSLCQIFHGNRCRLVTGGIDGQLRLYSMDLGAEALEKDQDTPCKYMGRLSRPANAVVSNEKVIALRTSSARYLGVLQANMKTIDVYFIRSSQECERKRTRRLRRRQAKQKKEEPERLMGAQKRGILDEPDDNRTENNIELTEEGLMDPTLLKASDEFEHLSTLRSHHKIRSFCFGQKKRGERLRIVCALATNAVEVHSLARKNSRDELSRFEKVNSQDFYGHPTGIRSVVLSSDDRVACTISKNVTKLWNVASRSCIQSLSPELNTKSKGCYGLCAAFLPGNSHIIMGTREGYLVMIEIASGNVVRFEEDAHNGAIWSVDVKRPTAEDPSVQLLTGSADKSVKFWSIEADNDEDEKNPSFFHIRTLQMTDDVIFAKYSRTTEYSKRLVFVSTLDSTIKVFFDDSLKLFLSLYGHKLPALAVDSSDDDTLLASSSADKTVKIWGLDFGDTHKTLLGHDDSVTDIKFVRGTHNFFTCSKDGSVRFWDGDRFEQILLIPGHFAEVNSLAIARSGAFLLSAGMDRQVRVLERTSDIVFLEEERDRELDRTFDKDSGREEGNTTEILDRNRASEDNMDAQYTDEPSSDTAVKQSLLSVGAGDRLMEALELADEELQRLMLARRQNGATGKARNALMLGKDPAHYVLWVLQTVKSSELEQSLSVMSMRHVERLLYYIVLLLRERCGVELCSRVAVFLAKAFQHQLIGNQALAPIIRELKQLLHSRLSQIRDLAGYDLAAMRMMSKLAMERRRTISTENSIQVKDIWADLGLGSDVAAALEGRTRHR